MVLDQQGFAGPDVVEQDVAGGGAHADVEVVPVTETGDPGDPGHLVTSDTGHGTVQVARPLLLSGVPGLYSTIHPAHQHQSVTWKTIIMV